MISLVCHWSPVWEDFCLGLHRRRYLLVSMPWTSVMWRCGFVGMTTGNKLPGCLGRNGFLSQSLKSASCSPPPPFFSAVFEECVFHICLFHYPLISTPNSCVGSSVCQILNHMIMLKQQGRLGRVGFIYLFKLLEVIFTWKRISHNNRGWQVGRTSQSYLTKPSYQDTGSLLIWR